MADLADRHRLYQKAVQCPGADLDFMERVYRGLWGRRPVRVREDFCGTGAIACEWARRRAGNIAVGLDLHGPTLAWGREHNVVRLKPAAAGRVKLLQRDVLRPGPGTGRMDAVLALNFSYWVFHTRAELGRYLRSARRSLRRGGVLVLDIFGGHEILREQRDRQQIGGARRGFTYIWHQARCDPVTHRTLCHIHFRFPDGSAMPRAFTYDWRAWTIPEVRELLAEAGFRRSTVYWEGDDEDGEGNGVFRKLGKKAPENCPSFVAYIVGER